MDFSKFMNQFVRFSVKYDSMHFCIWGHIEKVTPEYVFVDTSNGVSVMLDKKKIMMLATKDFSMSSPLSDKR